MSVHVNKNYQVRKDPVIDFAPQVVVVVIAWVNILALQCHVIVLKVKSNVKFLVKSVNNYNYLAFFWIGETIP